MGKSLETLVTQFRALFAASKTAGSITTPVPTSTTPSGDGVFDPKVSSDGSAFNQSLFAFFGVGASTTTATARLTAWRKTNDGSLWIPSPLLTLNLTFGTQIGVGSALVPSTNNFVSTIAIATSFTTAYEIISPSSDNTVALVAVDAKGAQLIQCDVAIGSCTSINVLASGF